MNGKRYVAVTVHEKVSGRAIHLFKYYFHLSALGKPKAFTTSSSYLPICG